MGKNKIISGGSLILASFIIKFLLDYPVNIFVLNFFGYIISVIIMTILHLFLCIIFVKKYDTDKEDIFLFEKDKQKNLNRKEEIETFIDKLVQGSKKFILFLIMSIKIPFLVVIYFREGAYLFNGFSGKKIKVITFFNILGISIAWNLILFLGFSLWEYLKTI